MMQNIREYTIADLRECLRTGELWQGEVIPITKHRALSHVNNPRAEPADVALLVAYDGETIVGYLGILPDKIFVGDQAHRIGWLTAWWAESGSKYTALGLMLLAKSLKAYGDNIGVSGFTPSARKFYDASKKFVTIREAAGVWAWVRSNAHEILPRKIPSLHALTLFLRLGDALVNLFLNLRLRLWNDGNVAVELSDTLDDEAAQFITMRNGSELTRRGVAELRWIVERPWILSASAAEPGRYYFSSVAREFSCRFVKVRDASNQLVALMMLSHRDGHVTVPYCYCDAANVEMMARAVGRILFESKASMFTCFNAELIDRLERIGFPFLYKRQITRPWIVSAKFKGIDFTKTTVQDGDGDCAFT